VDDFLDEDELQEKGRKVIFLNYDPCGSYLKLAHQSYIDHLYMNMNI